MFPLKSLMNVATSCARRGFVTRYPWISVHRSAHSKRNCYVVSTPSAVTVIPLGIAIVGGLLLSQVLTLYTTPVVYMLIDRPKHQPRSVRAVGDQVV